MRKREVGELGKNQNVVSFSIFQFLPCNYHALRKHCGSSARKSSPPREREKAYAIALHPLQCAHLLQVPHFPLYLLRSLSASKIGDVAQILRSECLLTFPSESGSLLHGVTLPLGSIVSPDTPAAQPETAVLPASPLDLSFICDARGSPVTSSRLFISSDQSDSYRSFTCSGFRV